MKAFNFNKSKIIENVDIIKKQLKKTRKKNKLSLTEIAELLKINIDYLKALEKGEFDKLPGGIYGKNFLQKYAVFLNLDADYLIDLFLKEQETLKLNKTIFRINKNNKYNLIVVSKIFKNIFIISVFLFFLAYLNFYINKIIAYPEIELYNLENNKIINIKDIKIIGKTEKETQIFINGEMVLVNNEGSFSKELILKEGLNIITIIAQKKHGKKNEIIRNIIVK